MTEITENTYIIYINYFNDVSHETKKPFLLRFMV